MGFSNFWRAKERKKVDQNRWRVQSAQHHARTRSMLY